MGSSSEQDFFQLRVVQHHFSFTFSDFDAEISTLVISPPLKKYNGLSIPYWKITNVIDALLSPHSPESFVPSRT